MNAMKMLILVFVILKLHCIIFMPFASQRGNLSSGFVLQTEKKTKTQVPLIVPSPIPL